MSLLLALDPAAGKSGGCGWAVFDGKDLASSGVIVPSGLDLASQYVTASNVFSRLRANSFDVFVAEWPVVYPGASGRGKDPNVSIIPLAGIVAHVSGMLPASVKRVTYKPRDWKGTVDGDAFVHRIRSRLAANELETLDAVQPEGLRHNATDAIGLGLHYLGRLGRVRVIAR